MGVQERKEREKNRLKQLILETATKMFIKTGYDDTSIRKIATEIEYSPATLYLYFENKDDLFYAIQEKAFEKFFTKLDEFAFIKDPLGRLRSIANSYVTFAMENPGLYKLMFLLDDPLNILESKKDWKPGKMCFDFIKKQIMACNEKNLIKKMSPDEGTFIFWSFMHGFSSLLVSQRLNFYGNKEHLNEQSKVIVDKMIETLKPSYF